MKAKNKNLLLISLLVYIQISLSLILIILLYTYTNKFFDKPYNQCAVDTKNEISQISGNKEVEVEIDGKYKITQARNMIESAGLRVKTAEGYSYTKDMSYKANIDNTQNVEYKICDLKNLVATKGVRIQPATTITQ